MFAKIRDLFSKITTFSSKNVRNTPILGRWCILNKEYNNRKIDMANIDHCGTCHYNYEKVNKIIDNKKESASFPIKDYK